MESHIRFILVITILGLVAIVTTTNAELSNYDYEDICSLTVDLGTCRAKVPRYYFNLRRKQCEIFYFGGCGGNSNNFKTLEECEGVCGFGEV